jgi:diadenosine tetraphosphate (Ap4A) HIT family hydrolase
MTAAIAEVRACIEKEHSPDAYNIGVNSGTAAGQTVPHVHIHVIPRYEGDVDDPRGGVRWVVPAKANYWSESG